MIVEPQFVRQQFLVHRPVTLIFHAQESHGVVDDTVLDRLKIIMARRGDEVDLLQILTGGELNVSVTIADRTVEEGYFIDVTLTKGRRRRKSG